MQALREVIFVIPATLAGALQAHHSFPISGLMITSIFIISVLMSDSLAVLIGDCSRLLRRRFDARARRLGVSRAQWQVLFALSRNEGSNQASLAEALDVETITVGRMVDRLEEAGLVERRADPADRRAWRLHLTPPAHPILAALREVGELVVAETFEGLGEADQLKLATMLNRIRTNLQTRPEPEAEPRPAARRAGRPR